LIFSEDEIKKFENIIENSDLVLFESETKKQAYSKKYTKENKVKSQIRKIYFKNLSLSKFINLMATKLVYTIRIFIFVCILISLIQNI
jgi:hypothetical protein